MSGTRFVLEYMIIITQHSLSVTRFVLEYMIIITKPIMSGTRFVMEIITTFDCTFMLFLEPMSRY